MNGRLKHEIKKRKSFESLEQEAALNVLRTSDQLHNRLGRWLREYGLTPAQYNVLRILRGAGEPLPSLEIAERLIQVVPAITRLIDRLEEQELVRRERCSEDRRIVYVELTVKGKNLVSQIDQPLHSYHKSLMGHLNLAELTDLIRLLEKARCFPADDC